MVTPGEVPTPSGRHLRVLRISHSGVVTSWRERERDLRRRGVDLTLVTAVRWDEGGAPVPFEAAGDDFVVPVRTFGTHPNLFVFDPRPLWRLLGDDRWDLVDLHEEPFGLAVAEFLVLRWIRRRRTPFLVCSAQNLDKRYPPPFRWIERRSLAGAAGAYTCNTEAGEILRRKGLHGELELLPLGVDVARFRPVERRSPAGRLRVGFVGRLFPVKGAHVLLAAAARDQRLNVDIYGAGPEAAALAAQAAELGVTERVTFHGHVEETELPSVYPTFDVLAVPSIPVPGSLEQFGRAVVEGQAAGVPSVASASGALPDVVGGAGLLVPPGDPEALCDALVRLLEEPGLWTRLRDEGLASVGRYSWAGIAELQEDLYQRAVRRG
ncbi:MAG TPA: glycosyltransferase family 4 protein [Acidimicrobiales bacterium]|nr:glycosyltransferase family 4 protein [Acidimicrobiales bacterium]